MEQGKFSEICLKGNKYLFGLFLWGESSCITISTNLLLKNIFNHTGTVQINKHPKHDKVGRNGPQTKDASYWSDSFLLRQLLNKCAC